MGKSRSANSVRNVSFGFAQQLITLVLAFVTRTIFVRKLGAEYTGVNGLYTNILTLLSLAELGIGNVLTYSLYGVLHDNDHEKLKQLISYYRKLYRYIAAAVTVVGLAIVPFLGQLVKSTLPHNEVVLYYLLFLCNSVVSYFVMFKVTLLRADQKEYIRNIVATICLLLQYVLQIAFLYVNNNYTTSWWGDYNKVKHNRAENDNIKLANLKNVFNALAALFILNRYLCKIVCSNKIMKEPEIKSNLFTMVGWDICILEGNGFVRRLSTNGNMSVLVES